MQTNLSETARQLARADEAESILRSCVHCGFCTATCPTYQLLGDELDGPRGRIYLIKQMLEGAPITASTQLHLDRCLTCRNCETTCPSGVKYHDLLDIGRAVVEQQVPRPLGQRLLRQGLRAVVPRPALFKALTRSGRALRPLLPATLKRKLPARVAALGQRPAPRHARRVLMLEGCVQPALSPNTNAAAARLLDRLGISVVPISRPAAVARWTITSMPRNKACNGRGAISMPGGLPSKPAPRPSCKPPAAAARSCAITATCWKRTRATPPRPHGSALCPATWWRCCATSRSSNWACASNSAWPSIAHAPCSTR